MAPRLSRAGGSPWILPEAWNSEWRRISPLHAPPKAFRPSLDGRGPPTASSTGTTAAFLNTPLMSHRLPFQKAVNIHVLFAFMVFIDTINTLPPVIFTFVARRFHQSGSNLTGGLRSTHNVCSRGWRACSIACGGASGVTVRKEHRARAGRPSPHPSHHERI